MKFEVKKECWHKGRRLMPGDILEVESRDMRWMEAQGKVQKVDVGTSEIGQTTRRRGRKAAPAVTAPAEEVSAGQNKTEKGDEQ